jgi:D-galactosamine 6-phosphate deaminase/isomerase
MNSVSHDKNSMSENSVRDFVKAATNENPLSPLLALSKAEKQERGIVHTPKEIVQQPETWLNTLSRLKNQQQEIRDFLSRAGVGDPTAQSPIVYLVGAGTSDHIGQSLHHLLRSKWQCEVIPVSSPNLLTDFPNYVIPGQQYLWISFSRSGDSPEGVTVLDRALAECSNVRHILVSCNAEGKMISSVKGNPNALGIVLDDATNDRGLAMTSSFTNMVLTGQVLAHAWSIDEYEPICQALVDAGINVLPQAAELASRLAKNGYSRACFVGSGSLAGAAMEAALKLLELTAGGVLTMSQSTLGLRHGPMAALNQDTLLVSSISSQVQRHKYELDLLREIGKKSLVRTRLAITTSNKDSLRQDSEYVLAPDGTYNIPDLYRPVFDIVFGQLLGMFASLSLGLKPDSPSPNGAISRVVQNVGIY